MKAAAEVLEQRESKKRGCGLMEPGRGVRARQLSDVDAAALLWTSSWEE